jgi:hypothetical protein
MWSIQRLEGDVQLHKPTQTVLRALREREIFLDQRHIRDLLLQLVALRLVPTQMPRRQQLGQLLGTICARFSQANQWRGKMNHRQRRLADRDSILRDVSAL